MDVMTTLLLGSLAVALTMAVQVLIGRRFGASREKGDRAKSLSRLLEDIAAAAESVIVICERCYIKSEKDQEALIATIKKAKAVHPDLDVTFVWGGDRLPDFLAEMEHAKLVEIHHARGPLPFTGRVIDGRTVEIHRGSNGNILPKTFLRAERAAPGVAERLTEKALAA